MDPPDTEGKGDAPKNPLPRRVTCWFGPKCATKTQNQKSQTKVPQVIECRAAVAWAPKEPLSIETVQVDPPKAHEIRIKVLATGVCHTDVSGLYNIGIKATFPCIMGHEGAGIIESVGEGVTTFQPGDHVIPLFMLQCGECRFCKSTKTNLCELFLNVYKSTMLDGTTRFTCKGQKLSHYMLCSTFSEYTVVHESGLCKINSKAPFRRACLLGCGVSTGYGAAIKTAKVEPGSTCAIWGLGGVGLACILGCKHSGASRIIGIDINPDKFEKAKKFGATECFNPDDYRKPFQEILCEMTGGGLDYTFECVGNVNTMKAAVESTVMGWGLTVIIGAPPDGHIINVSPSHYINGHTVTGSAFGGWKSKKDVPHLVEKYLEGKLPLDDFVTHEFPLKEINEAVKVIQSSECIRCIINL